MKLLLFFGVTLASLLISEATRPRLTLYSGRDQTGDSATYMWSVRDLGSWQRRARSACITGFWTFFSSVDFSVDSYVKLRSIGSGCLNLADYNLENAVRSVRSIGDPNDVAGRSLSLFEGDFYSGDLTYLAGDTSTIPNGGNYSSAAVSGNQAWSIYSGDHYTGSSTCLNVHPEYSPVYGWFDRATDMGSVGGAVRSAEGGCFSAKAPLGGANQRPLDVAVSYKTK